jgi:hypothetical protein
MSVNFARSTFFASTIVTSQTSRSRDLPLIESRDHQRRRECGDVSIYDSEQSIIEWSIMSIIFALTPF